MNKWKVSARHIFAVMAFWGMFNIFAMRANLSVAIVAMVKNTTRVDINTSDVAAYKTETQEDTRYDWDSGTQALVLCSFYFSYTITQIPGAVVARNFGAKRVFGSGVLLSAICCLLFPVVANYGVAFMVFIRVIAGFGEGITLPAMLALVSNWTPVMERSRINGFIQMGPSVGVMITNYVSAVICSQLDWASSFYCFGCVSCIWFIIWFFCIYESPDDHPTISREEYDRIKEGKQTDTNVKYVSVPWKEMLTSVPVWSLTIAHFGYDWGYYTVFMELPTYINDVLHFDLNSNGLSSAAPFLLFTIGGILSSHLADRLRKSGKLSISKIRKLFNTIGFIGPALCLLGIPNAKRLPILVVSLFTSFMFLNSFAVSSGFNPTHIDMNPEFAGVLYGITNTLAAVSGFLGPGVVGILTDGGSTSKNWNNVFYIMVAVYFATAAVFIAFGTAEHQTWGCTSKELKVSEETGIRQKQGMLANHSEDKLRNISIHTISSLRSIR